MELERECKTCGKTKAIEKFAKMYKKDRGGDLRRRSCTACAQRTKANNRRKRGQCIDCTEPAVKGGRCDGHHEKERQRVNVSRRAARLQVLIHYGGTPPSCKCCGEHRYEFLAIDHIEGGGRQERLAAKENGNSLHARLRKAGFPPGYRVLCHNCNASHGAFGYCPHERERESPLSPAPPGQAG